MPGKLRGIKQAVALLILHVHILQNNLIEKGIIGRADGYPCLELFGKPLGKLVDQVVLHILIFEQEKTGGGQKQKDQEQNDRYFVKFFDSFAALNVYNSNKRKETKNSFNNLYINRTIYGCNDSGYRVFL